jgi:hypothetical protein
VLSNSFSTCSSAIKKNPSERGLSEAIPLPAAFTATLWLLGLFFLFVAAKGFPVHNNFQRAARQTVFCILC